MALPAPGVTLAAKKRVTKLLQARGATIHELNAVRKHLSAIKGGHLARLAYPATVITLILSDVIGDDLDAIGSGPTVPDPTTSADAREGAGKVPYFEASLYRDAEARRSRVPPRAQSDRRQQPPIDRGCQAEGGGPRLSDDCSLDHDRWRNPRHRAHARGYRPANDRARAEGAACAFSPAAKPPSRCAAKALGGRNQEFVLAALLALEGTRGVTIFSAGTDGLDGPTDAAGAVRPSCGTDSRRTRDAFWTKTTPTSFSSAKAG